jgi:hypothetical protein
MESTEGLYWKPEPELGHHLFDTVPEILESQNKIFHKTAQSLT